MPSKCPEAIVPGHKSPLAIFGTAHSPKFSWHYGTLYPISVKSYEKFVKKKDPGNDPQCAIVPYIHPVPLTLPKSP